MRNNTIDSLRGIAFLLMIIQHIAIYIDIANNYNTNYHNNPIIDNCGVVARYVFILLAGVSVYLSFHNNKSFIKKRIKRSVEILLHGLVITITSALLYSDMKIDFGILHFIALGSFIVSLFAPYKILTIFGLFASILIQYPHTNTFLDTIFGTKKYYSTLDWFPLNSWLPVIFGGLIIGQNTNIKEYSIMGLKDDGILSLLGRNSLELYTIHVVLFMGIAKMLQK